MVCLKIVGGWICGYGGEGADCGGNRALLLFGLYGLFNDVTIPMTTPNVTSMFKLEGSLGGGVPGSGGNPNEPAFAVREEGDYKYTCNSRRWDVFVKNTSKTSYSEIQLEIAGICSCFQISKKFVNMLSIEDTIHFVYQTLCVFNMLTKSKISEARCSDAEDIVTMLSAKGTIHSYIRKTYRRGQQ